MSLEVLKSRGEMRAARLEMRNFGIDCADHGIIRFLKRWRILSGIKLGASVKSWDVLKTVRYLDERISRSAPVLDLGAYASELLPALYNLQFSDLTGIDLNPGLSGMPHHGEVRYIVKDFYQSGFPAASFSAITAISVIEHGFDGERLLSEVSRLLQPGGYFIASVDYWPDKIDTQGVKAFDMDWVIFSRDDLAALFSKALEYGLELCGETDFETEQSTVKWLGRSYTFAWMALRKMENRP